MNVFNRNCYCKLCLYLFVIIKTYKCDITKNVIQITIY